MKAWIIWFSFIKAICSCSHVADRWRPETIFVADRRRVHTALMLSVTQIGAIPLLSKICSEAILEYICQSMNNMKRNCPVGIIFSLPFSYSWYCWLLFSLQLTPCHIFLNRLNCSVLITRENFIPEHSAGWGDRSLQIINISEKTYPQSVNTAFIFCLWSL